MSERREKEEERLSDVYILVTELRVGRARLILSTYQASSIGDEMSECDECSVMVPVGILCRLFS